MTVEEKILALVKKLLVVGAVVTALVLWFIQWWLNHTPAQPIAFSHKVHVGQMQISCYFCHTGVLKSDYAGVPSVQDCMQCHQVINSQANPGAIPPGSAYDREINKLMAYCGNDPNCQGGKAIAWHQVYKLPGTVRFPHLAHVNYFLKAALKDPRLEALQKNNPQVYPCLICHGDVAKMSTIKPDGKFFYQVWYGYNTNPVTQMGYCVNCHRAYAGKELPGGPNVPPQEVMIDCSLCHK